MAWADSEFALARAETAQLLRRAVIGIAAAALALLVFTVALLILAQAAVVALAPALPRPELAGLAVGLALALCVVALGLVARRLLSIGAAARLHSPLLRWLMGAAAPRGETP